MITFTSVGQAKRRWGRRRRRWMNVSQKILWHLISGSPRSLNKKQPLIILGLIFGTLVFSFFLTHLAYFFCCFSLSLYCNTTFSLDFCFTVITWAFTPYLLVIVFFFFFFIFPLYATSRPSWTLMDKLIVSLRGVKWENTLWNMIKCFSFKCVQNEQKNKRNFINFILINNKHLVQA